MLELIRALNVQEDWTFTSTELWEKVHFDLPHCNIVVVKILD